MMDKVTQEELKQMIEAYEQFLESGVANDFQVASFIGALKALRELRTRVKQRYEMAEFLEGAKNGKLL